MKKTTLIFVVSFLTWSCVSNYNIKINPDRSAKVELDIVYDLEEGEKAETNVVDKGRKSEIIEFYNSNAISNLKFDFIASNHQRITFDIQDIDSLGNYIHPSAPAYKVQFKYSQDSLTLTRKMEENLTDNYSEDEVVDIKKERVKMKILLPKSVKAIDSKNITVNKIDKNTVYFETTLFEIESMFPENSIKIAFE